MFSMRVSEDFFTLVDISSELTTFLCSHTICVVDCYERRRLGLRYCIGRAWKWKFQQDKGVNRVFSKAL